MIQSESLYKRNLSFSNFIGTFLKLFCIWQGASAWWCQMHPING